MDDLPKVKNIDVLVSELDDYEAPRRNFKTINRSSHNFEDIKAKLRENCNSKPWLPAQNYDNLRKEQFIGNEAKANEFPNINKRNKAEIRCYKCNCLDHVASQCSNVNNAQIINCSQQNSQSYGAKTHDYSIRKKQIAQ